MRLAGQIKMGYYPTPPEIARIIPSFLEPHEKGKIFRILDPCCGEGEAVKIIADELSKRYPLKKFKTYGIELDIERYEKAKRLLNHTILADALIETRITNNHFSLLFLNPPYDWEKESESTYYSDSTRYEVRFLEKYTEKLRENGILVLVVPESFILSCTRRSFLLTYYSDIKVFRFPDKLYQPFKQTVIFARKKRNYEYVDVAKDLKEIQPSPAPQYTLPPSTILKEPAFISVRFDAEQLKRELKTHGIDIKQEIRANISTDTITPVMPLRAGHMALLLASGYMDGVIRKNRRTLVIKGFTKIEETRITEENEDGDYIEKTTTRPKTVINALDIENKKFLTIE